MVDGSARCCADALETALLESQLFPVGDEKCASVRQRAFKDGLFHVVVSERC